jgi:hypothetical protein
MKPVVLNSLLIVKAMKKEILKFRIAVMVLLLSSGTVLSLRSYGQPVIGILPVGTNVNSMVLNEQQWQSLSLQMQDLLVSQMKESGTIRKLSREHILLLLKELPSPDPENLTDEAYKIISKRENLNYLVRCTVESIRVENRNVQMPVRVVIIDGSTGKKFWEKSSAITRIISSPLLSEHLLLNEVFKPAISDLMPEIKVLNF